ncbi:hypothetical protein GNAINCEL_00106 [Serratia phage KKP 3709]|nr:hypothetical protein GNAINCEL_00106 [Serratia phage KKP 3709]
MLGKGCVFIREVNGLVHITRRLNLITRNDDWRALEAGHQITVFNPQQLQDDRERSGVDPRYVAVLYFAYALEISALNGLIEPQPSFTLQAVTKHFI